MNDVDIFLFHQANEFIIDRIRRKLNLPEGKVPFNSSRFGNTGPASIPLALSLEALDKSKENSFQKVILRGFGTGLSWRAIALSMANTHFCQIQFTKDHR
jgi:3-oxoacyl-[acyl-carrier-protein] synthase III